uniref:Putative phosphatidylglycerol/phosphatidylinositol transfer protein n=2 Tax=Noccaea caerulescens TaxID=107243 RepID=A0A1J3HGG0_NOCCA
MRVSFLVSLLLLGLSAVAAHPMASNWTTCTVPPPKSDALIVSSVSLNPDPPQRSTAEVVTLIGNYTGTAAVDAGTVTLTITLLGIPVFSQKTDICKVDGVNCPIHSGDSVTAHLDIPAAAIPGFSPPGAYVGQGLIVDGSGAELACISVGFNLS